MLPSCTVKLKVKHTASSHVHTASGDAIILSVLKLKSVQSAEYLDKHFFSFKCTKNGNRSKTIFVLFYSSLVTNFFKLTSDRFPMTCNSDIFAAFGLHCHGNRMSEKE